MAGIWRPFSDHESDEETGMDIDDDILINFDSDDNSATVADEPCLSDTDETGLGNIRYKRLSEDAQQIVLNVFKGLLKTMPKKGAVKTTAELTQVSTRYKKTYTHGFSHFLDLIQYFYL